MSRFINYVIFSVLFFQVGCVNSEDTVQVLAPATLNFINLTSTGEATLATTPSFTWVVDLSSTYELARYEVAVGTSFGGADVLSWQGVGTLTTYYGIHLNLSYFTNYYFSVRAVDSGGSLTEPIISDSFQVPIPPTLSFISLTSSGEATLVATPSFTWTVNRSSTYELERYEVAVGTSSGGVDVLGWQGVGTLTTYHGINLDLSYSTNYYFSVRAVDSGGSLTEPIISDSFQVPIPPTLSFISLTSSGEATLVATPSFTWTVNRSSTYELERYEVAIGTSSGGVDVLGWQGVGTLTTYHGINLDLSYSTNYYFSVRAVDSGGVSTVPRVSEAFQVPIPPTLSFISLTSSGEATLVATPSFTWTVNGSSTYELERYEVAVGTSSGGVDVLGWQGVGTLTTYHGINLDLSYSTNYYFSVRAVDSGGSLTEPIISQAFQVPIPPTLSFINLTSSGEATLAATPSFTWTVNGSSTYELERYEVAVGTSSGGVDVLGWQGVGAVTTYQATSLSLDYSTNYYFSVRAVDSGGVSTVPRVSEAFQVPIPPTLSFETLTSSGEATLVATPSFTWTVNGSSTYELERYEVAVGTSSGGVDVLSWQGVGAVTTYQATSLSLDYSTNYYFSVRAVDSGGVSTVPRVSEAFQVPIPPTLSFETLTSSGEATLVATPSFTWTVNGSSTYELERYEVAIGTSSGGVDVLSWQGVGAVTTYQATSLSLDYSTNYYFSVRAVDSGGVSTVPRVSEAFQVPIPPTLSFISLTSSGEATLVATPSFTWTVNRSSTYELERYEVAVGTSSGGVDVLGWQGVGTLTTYHGINLDLSYSTNYYFSVRAVDSGGSLTEPIISDSFQVPIPPTLSFISLTSSGEATLVATPSFTWTVNRSSTYELERYEVAIGTSSGGVDVLGWQGVGAVTTYQATSLSLDYSTDYYFSVRAVDSGGSLTEPIISDSFQVPIPPTLSFETLTSSGEATLVATPSFTWTVNGSSTYELERYEVAVGTSSGGVDVLGWQGVGAVTTYQATSLSLDYSTNYYFSVRAVDSGGSLTEPIISQAFQVPIPPTLSFETLTSSGEATLVATPSFTWTVNRSSTYELERYEVAIGTSSGGVDVLSWQGVGTLTTYHGINLDLSYSTNYYFSVRAVDSGGISTVPRVSEAFQVPIPPTLSFETLTSSGEATLVATPSFTWTVNGSSTYELERYEVAVGTSSGGVDVLSWQGVGAVTTYQATDLNLSYFTNYYFSVRAVDSGGSLTEPIISQAFQVPAPPKLSFETLTSSGEATLVATPSFTWAVKHSSNYELARYEVAIGTSSGGVDVLSWQGVGAVTTYQATDLNLSYFTNYYFSVRAVDSGGSLTEPIISQAFQVPIPPTLSFETLSLSGEATLTTTPSFTWAVKHSSNYELARYEVAIGTSSGGVDVLSWQGVGAVTTYQATDLNLSYFTNYYFSVRAVDSGGSLTEPIISQAFQVPAPPKLSFETLSLSGEATLTTTPSFTWAVKHSSNYELARYEVAIGTSSGGVDVLGWQGVGAVTTYQATSLSLDYSTNYYFSVRAVDSGGSLTEPIISEAFEVPIPPTLSFISLTSSGEATLVATPSFTWDVKHSSNYELARYEVAIGTSSGGVDVLSWQGVGAVTTYQATDLNLSYSTNYYFSVRAVDSGGSLTEPIISDSFQVPIPPTLSFETLTSSGEATLVATPSFTWTVNGSSNYELERYEVAIGTSSGGVDVLSWQGVGAVTTYQATDLNLSYSTNYYFSIRAVDSGGSLTEPIISDSFQVPIPPTLSFETLTSSGEATLVATPSFTWTVNRSSTYELERYEVAIGTSSGGVDVLSWQGVGTLTTYHGINLDLSYSTNYYFSVRAVDSGGSLTEPIISEAFEVPIPPTLSFKTLTSSGEATLVATPSFTWTVNRSSTYELARYEVAIGTSSGGVDVLGWQGVGTLTTYQATSLSLDYSTNYYFSVRAVDSGGVSTLPRVSEAFQVPIPPTLSFETLTSSGEATLVATPSFTWTVNRSSTYELERYEVAIGTSSGGVDVLSWQGVGTLTTYHGINLDLSYSTNYYFSVRAVDSGGISTVPRVSEAFQVPIPPTLSFISLTSSGEATLVATPSFTWTVNRSSTYELERYEVAIGTSSGGVDVLGWQGVGTLTTYHGINLDLSYSTNYYFSVRAVDSEGSLTGPIISEAFQVPTPPFSFTGLSFDGEFIDGQAPAISWTVRNALEVDHYEVAIGDTLGGTNLLNWLTLTSGQTPTITFETTFGRLRYTSVRALDSNGLVLGTVQSLVHVQGHIPGGVVDTTHSRAVLFIPGIEVFSLNIELAIGTVKGGDDIFNWLGYSRGELSRSYQISSGEGGQNFTLEGDTPYYISARFTSGGVTYSYTLNSFSVGPVRLNLTDYPKTEYRGSSSITGKSRIAVSFIGNEFTDEKTTEILNHFFGNGSRSLFKTAPFRGKQDRFVISYQNIRLDPNKLIVATRLGYDVNVVIQHSFLVTANASSVTGDLNLKMNFVEPNYVQITETFVHEMGHAFGDLRDEYNYSRGGADSSVIDESNCGNILNKNRWLGIDDYQGELFPDGCATRQGGLGAVRGLACVLLAKTSPESSLRCLDSLMRVLPYQGGYNNLEEYKWSSIWGSVNRYYLSEKLSQYAGDLTQRTLENFHISKGKELVVYLDSAYKVNSVTMSVGSVAGSGLSLSNVNMTRSSLYKNRFSYKFSDTQLLNDAVHTVSFAVFDEDDNQILLKNTVLNQIKVSSLQLAYNWRGWSITPKASNGNPDPLVSHSNLNLEDDDIIKIYLDSSCLKEVGSGNVSSNSTSIALNLREYLTEKPNASYIQSDVFFYFYGRSFRGGQAFSECSSMSLSYKRDRSPNYPLINYSQEEKEISLSCGVPRSMLPVSITLYDECKYVYEITGSSTPPSNLIDRRNFQDIDVIDVSGLNSGTYYIHVVAEDEAGNISRYGDLINGSNSLEFTILDEQE